MITHSAADDAFKRDVLQYAGGGSAPRIRLLASAPRIKVLRLLAQLLAEEPDLAIEAVAIHATSGCADFRGTVTAETPSGPRAFRFVWDCRWRAEREGWYDAFQFPDQIRAAQEFGWRCFAEWVHHPAPDPALAAAGAC
jgi:hypothetical protein